MAKRIAQALERLLARQDLTRGEAQGALAAILAGEATGAQIAGLLVGLAVKGETVEEIVGFASAMRAAAASLGTPPRGMVVDTCGTGGVGRDVFNISTAAAFVAAGAGLTVAKHGNRSATSHCGSADVVEALGVNLAFPAGELGACLEEIGIAFLYAPLLHGSTRHAQPVRRELGIRTVFNLLGPLTNPAGAAAQVVGVYSRNIAATMAAALIELGVQRAFIVHGDDGLMEFSTTAATHVVEINQGLAKAYSFDARDYGIRRARLEDFACGGDLPRSAALLREVLEGGAGPRRDVVALNAAAALVAGARAADFGEGLAQAYAAMDSGAALGKLRALAAHTRGRAAEAGA